MDYYGHLPMQSFFDQGNMSIYMPGGLYPVSLGDTFKDGRYQRPTQAWMGRLCYSMEEWVAMKILAARSNQEKSSKEISILGELRDQSSRGNTEVATLLDEFYIEGPNGSHRCLVMELLGPSLASVINDCNFVPPGQPATSEHRLDSELILRGSKQWLRTLMTLHERGIAHGDISAHNIAFTAKNLRTASEHDIFEILGGAPEVEDLIREDGKPLDPSFPRHIVRRAEWEWIDEDEEDIHLIDWGESFRQGEEPHHLSQPADSRAPETIFTDKLVYRIDLWRTGLVICRMIFGHKPFGVFKHDAVFLVPQMINFVEDLPDEWSEKWQNMKGGLVESDDVNPVELELQEIRSLDKLFGHVLEDPDDPPLQPLLPIIKGLMKFRPSDRLTASQALELPPPLPDKFLET